MNGMTFSYKLGWWIFRFIFKVYFRWRIHHADRVPLTGPVILASNHTSYLDPPLVGCALPRPINYLARDSLFRFPIFGQVVRSWNAIPVDRSGTSPAGLRNVLNRIDSGGSVVLFPEGTRSHDGNLQPARSGIGLVVIKSDAPVVPVRIIGTFEAYGRKMIIPRPRRVQVIYGKPLQFRELRQEAAVCDKARLKEIYQEVADQLMKEIAGLHP